MSKKITFVVTFKGGAGEITFTDVDGLADDTTLDCDGSNPTDVQSFSANQSTGPQSVTVGGTAPDGGSITVEVKDGDKVLKSVTFNSGEFDAQVIDYDVA